MTLHPVGCDELDEDVFVQQFEACTLPSEIFKHRDHVHLAFIYVRRFGAHAAEARIVDSIRRFATSLNHPEKYHDTITRAWLRLVAMASGLSPQIADFREFAEAHRWLFDARTLDAFYSAPRLRSDEARVAWIEPDVQGLPTFTRAARR